MKLNFKLFKRILKRRRKLKKVSWQNLLDKERKLSLERFEFVKKMNEESNSL